MGQFGEELIKFLLPLIELATPYIIYSEESHDAVDN